MIHLKRTFVIVGLFLISIPSQSVFARVATPVAFAQMEGYAEGIAETYKQPNWSTLSQTTAQLRKLWKATSPTLKADSKDVTAFDLEFYNLENAVRQRSSWKAAHSANALTFVLIDLQNNLLPASKVPVAVGKMDFWGREIALQAQVGQWNSTMAGVQQLNVLWKSLRAQVLMNDLPLTQKVDSSIEKLAKAVRLQATSNTLKYSALILERVDDLESNFEKR